MDFYFQEDWIDTLFFLLVTKRPGHEIRIKYKELQKAEKAD